MRATLGQLRNETPDESAELREAGLDRLPALCEAVTAAGAPVTLTTEGQPRPLSPAVGHAAYRILQESLTNVLRHAGAQAQRGGVPDLRARRPGHPGDRRWQRSRDGGRRTSSADTG